MTSSMYERMQERYFPLRVDKYTKGRIIPTIASRATRGASCNAALEFLNTKLIYKRIFGLEQVDRNALRVAYNLRGGWGLKSTLLLCEEQD